MQPLRRGRIGEQCLSLGRRQGQPGRDLVGQLVGVGGQFVVRLPSRETGQERVVDAEQVPGAPEIAGLDLTVGLAEEVDLGAQVGRALRQQLADVGSGGCLPRTDRRCRRGLGASSRISARVPTSSTSGPVSRVCWVTASVPLRSATTPKDAVLGPVVMSAMQLAIARFEDVQRQRHAGQQHMAEREERDDLGSRPHRSRVARHLDGRFTAVRGS